MFYKKKHRRLQIVLADESVKTVLIDDSAKARDIVKTILENLALKTDFEAWGLRKLDSSESEFLNRINILHKLINFSRSIPFRATSPLRARCRRH